MAVKNSALKMLRLSLSPDLWSGDKIPLPTLAELQTALSKTPAIQGAEYAKQFGWALLSRQAYRAIRTALRKKNTTHVLGLGSGGGYIERLLELGGFRVIATDTDVVTDAHYLEGGRNIIRGQSQMPVRAMTAGDAIREYKGYALLMCWPTTELFRSAESALKDRTCVLPETLLFFIGSGYNERLLSPFELRKRVPLPRPPQFEQSTLHIFVKKTFP